MMLSIMYILEEYEVITLRLNLSVLFTVTFLMKFECPSFCIWLKRLSSSILKL